MSAYQTRGDGGSPPERVGELALGVVLELLRSRRRRLLLDYLERDNPAEFGDVVDYVVREEAGLGYSDEERKRVYVALYQNHVPKFDEAGVVKFEGTDSPLSQGEAFGEVYDTLERLRVEATDGPEVRPRWERLRDLFHGG